VADFAKAFERALLAEGGYKLHNVAGDTGGLTYAGIARNKNPQWPGWPYIDRGDTPPAELVRAFYRTGWWTPIAGDDISSQDVAFTIYSFATNSSAYKRPAVAIKLAQLVVGVTPDGTVGPKTVAAINAMNPELFLAKYALARLSRYAAIVNKDRTQGKFLLGWVNRTLREAT
jgi:lysozyme family protein